MIHLINQKQINTLLRFLILVSLFGSFALAFYTLHDLQTAEGAGLYLSITYNSSSRILFDAVIDITGMLLLFLVTFLPILIMGKASLDSFFRFFSIYLAFMPIIHPGNVVHLLNAFQNITFRPNLINCNWENFLFQDLQPIFDMLKWLLPLILLLYAFNKISGGTKVSYRKWFLFLFLIFIFCFCIFENIAFTFLYLAYYLLFLWLFKETETFFLICPSFAPWSYILFGGCLLRGIYRMLHLISITHI